LALDIFETWRKWRLRCMPIHICELEER